MTTPLTNTQVPNNSILDLFGRQTYLGNSFILPQDGLSLANTVETPVAYLVNPSTSSKSLFVFSRKISSDNNPVQVRFYKDPTVNVIGTATVAKNLRSGFSAIELPQATCYLASTFTANGTQLSTLPATVYGLTSDVLYVIDPGSALLATGKQVGAGTTSVYVELCWYEI